MVAPRVVHLGRRIAEQASYHNAQRTQEQAKAEARLVLRHCQPHASAHNPEGQNRSPHQHRQHLIAGHRDLLSTSERQASGLFAGASRSLDHAVFAVAVSWGGIIVLVGLAALVSAIFGGD